MSTVICLSIESCQECPKSETKLTKGFGHAYNRYCTVVNRKIVGYVEWDSEDIQVVPEWCPLRR